MLWNDGWWWRLEVLKLLSSTSAQISQGEVLQLQHKNDIDILEETYLKIISWKTASLFASATKVGAILSGSEQNIKDALNSYGKNFTETALGDTVFYKEESTESILNELESFAESINNNTIPKVTLIDGYEAVSVANEIMNQIKW